MCFWWHNWEQQQEKSMRFTDLNRMDPGLGAPNALHRGDGSSVELTERQQAGVG